MDNKKRLKRKVNAKLKTVLLMLLAIMFVISSLMTVSAATIKDDGKYTLRQNRRRLCKNNKI